MDKNQIEPLLRMREHTGSLLFPGGEREQEAWWKRIGEAASYRPMIGEIRAEAERLLQQQAPELTYALFRLFKEQGTRLEYERAYFEMRRRLNTFAIMSLLEPERESYFEALQETLWSICNEYTWSLPAHVNKSPESTAESRYSLDDPSASLAANAGAIDLFSAETGFALSEILRLTEHRLPLLLRNRIVHETYRRIFWPFVHQGPFHWEKATTNWSAVCAGSVGAAALHLIEDSGELALVLERVFGAMESYISGFTKDGATTEGYGYWYYGFGFFVFFADLLKTRTAGSLDLLSGERMHQIALFQQKCFLSGASVVNFSDSRPTSHIHIGLTHYLHRLYPDVELPDMELRTSFTEDHCSRWATAFRNLLWFREEKAAAGAPWGPATYVLEDAQWVVTRHAADSGLYCFAAKGGHNDEPHNHNDIGHFIVHCDGETFLADLGCGMYTQSYFGAARYEYACNGAQGHSVPIIDGKLQQEGAGHRARQWSASANGEAVAVQMDLSAAYGADTHLKRLTRCLTWHKRELPMLALVDTFEMTVAPDSVTERFISFIEPERIDGRLILRGSKRRLVIAYDGSLLEPELSRLEFIDHFGVEQAAYAIDLKLLHPAQHCSAEVQFHFELI